MYFIGDVHGEFSMLNFRLSQLPEDAVIIQVGDFGAGGGSWARYIEPVPEFCRKFMYIHGNHDYMPWYIGQEKPIGVAAVGTGGRSSGATWIPSGTVMEIEDQTVAFLGGADSVVDRAWRTEGRDWWPEETVDHKAAQKILDFGRKIDILVTHDAPIELYFQMRLQPYPGNYSAQLLSRVWKELGEPKLVCGHHHPDDVVRYKSIACLPIHGVLQV